MVGEKRTFPPLGTIRGAWHTSEDFLMSETLGWNRADAIISSTPRLQRCDWGVDFFQESLRLSKGGRKGEDERAIDDRPYSDTFSKEKADASDELRDAQRDELATASVMILPLAKVMSAYGTFLKMII